MANYKPDQDVFDSAPSVPVAVQADTIKEAIFETLEAKGFMESVKETVNAAAQSVLTVPVESAKDDLNDDSDESEPDEHVATVAGDFWF
jgi:hypothetical protein